MQRILTILALSAAIVAVAVAPASARTDLSAVPSGAEKNIVQTAVAAGKFKTLASLLKKAGLAGTLQGKGPFTVFAPTDAAFAKVPSATLEALGKDKAKLRSVLLYHVAKGKLTAAKVVKRDSVKTLNGQRVKIRVRDDKVFVGGARVTTAGCRRVERGHPHHQQGADPALSRAARRPARFPRRAAALAHGAFRTPGSTAAAASSICRGSSPIGQRCTRWHPAWA